MGRLTRLTPSGLLPDPVSCGLLDDSVTPRPHSPLHSVLPSSRPAHCAYVVTGPWEPARVRFLMPRLAFPELSSLQPTLLSVLYLQTRPLFVSFTPSSCCPCQQSGITCLLDAFALR